jgi:murein DD-endopeptidase MepM/ murein hydrolase activator NlpD
MAIQFVAPQAGSGSVLLRSAPNKDQATQVGQLNEGARLELDAKGAEWHTCKVYVAASVAVSDGKFVTPMPPWQTINIRSAPQKDPSTDVGDLAAGQRLELISPLGEWFIARVYVSAQFTDVSGDQPAPPPPPPPDGIDVPSGSPLTSAELQALSLAPAKKLAAPAGSAQAAFSAARIWNKYGGLLEPLANKIGIDPAISVAVVAVESGGSGIGPDGRMIIRFENHLFWFNWGKANADAYNALFKFDPTTTWKGHQFRSNAGAAWQDVHTNQASEWAALTVAQGLNAHAAIMSISMGLVQILGSNNRAIGYASPEAMFDAFGKDERYQLLGFFNFVKNDQRQITALQNRDFVGFARIYNGPGQPDYYGGLMKSVADGFTSLVGESLDQFDAPIGTPEERATAQIWPGTWIDATPYGTRYDAGGTWAISTGADLNLPNDQDAQAPVYAAADGIVRASAAYPVWGNVIVIEHTLKDGTTVWTRYALLDDMAVQTNQAVQRGQLIGHVGNGFGRYSYHLHFDIAYIDLGANPTDHPGDDQGRVMRDYLDPQAFITAHHLP